MYVCAKRTKMGRKMNKITIRQSFSAKDQEGRKITVTVTRSFTFGSFREKDNHNTEYGKEEK